MKVTIWGCRGSLPSPGPENNHYGGNTSCVEVWHNDTLLILDAGSGIQRLGGSLPRNISRIDILLTHLHLDHIMGLGFFQQLYNPNVQVNIWGPTSSGESLEKRLKRYLSPPLFPVRLQDLPSKPNILEINQSSFQIGPFQINSEYICHPGPTVGYRISDGNAVLAYMPDHEPALGSADFPHEPEWTSGYNIAYEADLLLHDAQYWKEEYKNCIGWGHSSANDALKFAKLTKAKKILFFHHDPSHSDEQLQKLFNDSVSGQNLPFEAGIAAEGNTIQL